MAEIDRKMVIEKLHEILNDRTAVEALDRIPNRSGYCNAIRNAFALLKEQENRIKDLEEKLRIDISLKERNDNFDLYDTPIFGFHD